MPEKFTGIAKEYSNVGEFNEDAQKVFAGRETGMYKRYDYEELAADEKKFAEMVGVPDTALFNSGMAAIHTAIEVEGLKSGDVVLCSNEVYGVTKEYIASLKKRGIKIQYFDPSDIESLKVAVDKERPRLIIAETVANSKEMKMANPKAYAEIIKEANEKYHDKLTPKKVLDNYLSVRESLKNLPETSKQKILQAIDEFQIGNNPFVFRDAIKDILAAGLSRKEAINEVYKAVKHVLNVSREKLSLILDNTLPSPILINPIEQVGDITSEVTVVESGTKHYQGGKNKITMGIAYSKDPEKIKQMKNLRVQTGAYLQATSEEEIPGNITSLMPEILKRHAANALVLARALEAKGFTVYHPNLRSHKQNELADRLAPNGAVTLFYVDMPSSIVASRDAFMEKVKKMGGVAIGLGSSFGHEKTWLSNFALGDRTIRIAVGMESPEEFTNVVRIFEEAANN